MAGLATPQGTEQDVTVGLVGPHGLLERIVLAAGLPGQADPGAPAQPGRSADALQHRRLLLAPYRDEQEAPERAARLAGAADALLFAGPAPLAYATRADALSCPATSLELAGGPLAATLTRASGAGIDPSRASFDSFSRAEVSQALDDAGISASCPHVRDELASPAALTSYHARLWRIGLTSAAITSLDEVARRLAASAVPAFVVRPSEQSVSAGLQTATLLAHVVALASSQLAVALVEVPALREAADAGEPRLTGEEMRLRVHAFLVREAGRIGATVSPVSGHGFLVVGTRGALTSATTGPLFAGSAHEQLGLTLDVGIGTGRTERDAEDAARQELRRNRPPAARHRIRSAGRALVAGQASGDGKAAGDGSGHGDGSAPGGGLAPPGRRLPGGGQAPGGWQAPAAYSAVASLPGRLSSSPADAITSRGGSAVARTAGARTASAPTASARTAGARQRTDSLSRLRSLETLARLAQKLAADASPVVDAELTGQLLSVTPRTARRQLRALADQGLALPLPPRRTPHPGRPRQAYRLVVEKLDRSAAHLPPAADASRASG
jgi:hypothetical protein